MRIPSVIAILTAWLAGPSPSLAQPVASAATPPTPGAWLHTQTLRGSVPVASWKRLRDAGVVRQNLDYSCGAASLATLLNGYYGQAYSEADLLKLLGTGNSQASFEDMARAVKPLGFKAVGLAASWEQLTRLKMPVVVYLKLRKDEHFAVLRGIDADTVWLADPSLGNQTYSREQFLAIWNTRRDLQAPELSGKFLALFPLDATMPVQTRYFSREPRRQSLAALAPLAHRRLP